LKVASDPSVRNFSMTRFTIATASAGALVSAADAAMGAQNAMRTATKIVRRAIGISRYPLEDSHAEGTDHP
jgi:hypothetical protein